MRVAPVFVLAFLAAACAGIVRPLETPRADLRAVTLADVSAGGVTLALDLAVTNPNSVALPLRAVDWELQVDDTPIARGRLELAATIPAKGSAPVQATITLGVAQAIGIAAGTAVYVSGTMHFETPAGDVAATFDLETTL